MSLFRRGKGEGTPEGAGSEAGVSPASSSVNGGDSGAVMRRSGEEEAKPGNGGGGRSGRVAAEATYDSPRPTEDRGSSGS